MGQLGGDVAGLAGYRRVIGTSWAAHDSEAPWIVSTVYARLAEAGMNPRRQAPVPAHGDLEARRRYPAARRAWAGYMKVGP
jgi:hypothetical protein